MPWTTATTRSTGFNVTAAVWNAEHVDNMNYLKRPAVQTFTADVSVTGTSAVQIVSLGALTYEATPYLFEFWCSRVAVGASGNLTISLRDVTTEVGIILQPAASVTIHAVYWAQEITPTAASHTYNIAATNGASQTSTVNAGAGGPGVRLPGTMRVTRVPA